MQKHEWESYDRLYPVERWRCKKCGRVVAVDQLLPQDDCSEALLGTWVDSSWKERAERAEAKVKALEAQVEERDKWIERNHERTSKHVREVEELRRIVAKIREQLP